MRSGHQHVNAQRVEFNFRRRERTDRVHDEHHVGIFLFQCGDFRERAHHAGRSLVVNQREGIEPAAGKLFVHLVGADGRTPGHLERLGVLAAAFGNFKPLVGKRAAHAVQHFPGNEIAQGAFHDAPGGGGAEENELLGVKEPLQLRLDFPIKVFELLPAMADHRRTKGPERFLAHLDRSGNVQFDARHKQGAKFFIRRV